jgi:hypothetical protein
MPDSATSFRHGAGILVQSPSKLMSVGLRSNGCSIDEALPHSAFQRLGLIQPGQKVVYSVLDIFEFDAALFYPATAQPQRAVKVGTLCVHKRVKRKS